MKETKECLVCLTELKKSTKVRLTTCFHLFHDNCLELWLKKIPNCPFCRQRLSRVVLELYEGENENGY